MFEKLKSKFKVFQQKLRSFKLGRKGLKSENGDVQGPANCISCDGKVGSDQTNPCGHYYCQECLSEMAGLALKDKSLIPIR